MNGATLLFEPLPIGRLGVRREDDAVVIATDYSSFAYILEEFIALGIRKIAVPKSFPEISALSSAPQLLRQRISVFDDANEIEAADRLLQPIMSELKIEIDGETGNVKRPTRLPQTVFSALMRVRRDIKCLALGLNRSVQIEIDVETSKMSTRKLREVIKQPNSRTLLASIEGIFSYYEEISYDAMRPPMNVPSAMVSLFDRLINDPRYVEYSDAVATLGRGQGRRATLSRIQRGAHVIASSDIFAHGWNLIAKAVKVCTHLPIPESNVLSALFPGKTLPTIVALQHARQRALPNVDLLGGPRYTLQSLRRCIRVGRG